MKKLPKGIKKRIRREKARIRRDIFVGEEREEAIKKLYSENKPKKNEGRRNSQSGDKERNRS